MPKKAPLSLDIRVKSQLIVDLVSDDNAGLKFYLLANKRQDLYGKPNSSLRKVVANRKDYLLKLKSKEESLFWKLYQEAVNYLTGEADNYLTGEASLSEEAESEEAEQDTFNSEQGTFRSDSDSDFDSEAMKSPPMVTRSSRSRPTVPTAAAYQSPARVPTAYQSPARAPFSPHGASVLPLLYGKLFLLSRANCC